MSRTVLDRVDCLALLGTATLGRVAVSVDAMPLIVPVAYRLVGDTVSLRAGHPSLARAASAGHILCFEVDRLADDLGAGWCVSMIGPVSSPTSDELPAVAAEWTDLATADPQSSFVLRPAIVTGWRS